MPRRQLRKSDLRRLHVPTLPASFAGTESFFEDLLRSVLAHSDSQTVAASVRRAVDQTAVVTATTTAVVFDTSVADNGGMWASTVPTRLTAPISGWYMVTGAVEWDTDTNGTRDLRIVHSTVTKRLVRGVPFGGKLAQEVSLVVPMLEGEYVELGVTQDSGTDRTLVANDPWAPMLSAAWLAPYQE